MQSRLFFGAHRFTTRPSLLGLALLACALSLAAKNAGAAGEFRHTVSMSVLADANDNRQWLGKLVLPMGDHLWVQGHGGKTLLSAAPDIHIIGTAFGIQGSTFGAAVEFTRRKQDAFELKDWHGVFDWRGARGGMGADVFQRAADGESTSTSQTNGLLGSSVTTTSRESADGKGWGLHGYFDVTERVRLSGGLVRYGYEFESTSVSNEGNALLPALVATATSVVTRDQELIDRTYQAGVSYRVDGHAIAMQFLRDRVTRTGEMLNTYQLQAELDVGRHWSLLPLAGRSTSDRSGGVNFGGLGVTFKW